MARFYANENFPLPTVLGLRELGHDVLTVLETGRAEQSWPDDEVLAFATKEKRAVLTFNRKHFVALHSNSDQHAGIIACTFDSDFVALAERIHAATNQATLSKQLIRVNRPNLSP